MKVLFYSNQCRFCKDIIKQLNKSEFHQEFQLINVDNSKVPEKIKIVPTIIDSDYKDLLEGKKAFEYLYNSKYFNLSTNNLLLWKDKELAKPDIKEDTLAFQSDISQEIYSISDHEAISKNNNEKENKKKIKISNNSLIKLKLRR